jgi:hypothetical protein
VTVRVAPSSPRARERARLEARVTGAASRIALAVRWRFGDGTEATGPAVSHRWRAAGVYSVVATAEGDDDSGGASDPLVVRVGPARERSGPAGGGGGDRERAPATGPAEPPDDPAPLPPAPAPAPPASDAGEPAPPATSARSPRRRARPRKERLRARDGDALPGAVPVRGVLVAATVPAATAAPPAGAPRPPASARAGGPPEHRNARLPAAGALAGALLALALGAWRERRRRHP